MGGDGGHLPEPASGWDAAPNKHCHSLGRFGLPELGHGARLRDANEESGGVAELVAGILSSGERGSQVG